MWEQQEINKRNSAILITIIAVLMFSLGYVLGELFSPGLGILGVAYAAGAWIFACITGFFFGGNMILRLNRAKKITPENHQLLYNVVEEMKIASGIEKIPDIYVIDSPVPNAFATGRNPDKSAVAVTTKLLTILNREELQCVIAHEIAHIINRDTLYLTMAGIMIGTITMLAEKCRRSLFYAPMSRTCRCRNNPVALIFVVAGVVLMVVAPVLGRILYFSISRKREYLADACAAQFTRCPYGLASALEKLSAGNRVPQRMDGITAAMCIVNPFEAMHRRSRNWFLRLFSTHPPAEERINILKSMISGDFSSYSNAFSKITKKELGIDTKSAPKPAGTVFPIQGENILGGQFSVLDNARETVNLAWAMGGYSFINCDCDTKLKIPPEYTDIEISCPHCQKKHFVGAAHAQSR